MLKRIEVGIDCSDPERLATFWSEALGYAVGDLDPAGVYLDLVPPHAALPAVYFQRVPEAKSTKNRVHLDLWEDDVDVAVSRLVVLGATVVGTPRTGSAGGRWQVMTDPEGNEFCVCQAS
jgi:predicted enzyme related to lactoylglutathione lyase